MSNSHPKLIDLDFASGAGETRSHTSPIIPMPGHNSGAEGGATAEVRDLMDQMQQTAWEARARLRAVEEERDGMAARCQEVQRGNDELRGRLAEVSLLVQERDRLQTELQRSTRVAQDREGRAMMAEKQTQELQRRCDDLTRQRDELNRSLQAQAQVASQRGADPATLLSNLRQARDSAQATVRDLTDKLARAENEIADLQDQVEALGQGGPLSPSSAHRPGTVPDNGAEGMGREALRALQQQRDESQLQLAIVSKEVLSLRSQLEERTSANQDLLAQIARAQRMVKEAEASVEPLLAEQTTTRSAYEEAMTSLTAAQKQIERLMKERDEVREEARGQALVLEETLEKQRHELRGHEQRATAYEMALQESERLQDLLSHAEAERAEVAERYEAQRLQTIDLGARLEAEQYQIKVMSSRLAEARLLGRMGNAKPEGTTPADPEPQPALEPELVTGPSFDTELALESIRAMRRCYHAFAKATDDFSHLNELHTQIHTLAEHAQESEFVALHRLVAAFDAFIQELYHFPEQINPTSLHTIPQTIEFLAALMKLKDPRVLRDAASATVYVVEDDPLTCECLMMAMETCMMRGLCSQDPAKAAYELAGTPCDLILMDINMPGMDGFELCASIRGLSLHQDTPIMFLSGMHTLEMRERAALVGGCDFLPKPFILCELTLKALLHIAKAQLRIA